MLVLTVKRHHDSIAQYLHESSSFATRPYQVHVHELLASGGGTAGSGAGSVGAKPLQSGLVTAMMQQQWAAAKRDELLTVYDITVSATVALNVTLPSSEAADEEPFFSSNVEPNSPNSDQPHLVHGQQESADLQMGAQLAMHQTPQLSQQQSGGINTVLNFQRGQRMSFECHLEITGTDFGKRERININETGQYTFCLLPFSLCWRKRALSSLS